MKATALAGFIGQQIALLSTFGVQIYAAAAATGAWNKVLIITKGLLATMPWAAAAAAIGFVAVKTLEAKAAQDDYNRALKAAPLTK